jgi:hypothetical protein
MDSHLAIVMAMFFVGLLATLCFTVLKYGIRNEWPLFEALMRDEAKRTETLKTLDIGVYMCVWICSSVAFTMFNKFVFSVFDGGKISYPMIMCATQYAFKWAFSAVYLKCYEGKIDPGPGKPMDYLLLYVPIGLSSSLDLILSNEAMKRISVSAYTVLKSTGLIYVYFISVALGLKSFHFNTLACVMAMVLGMAAVVWGYMGDSSHFGLVAVTAASLVGALRWSYIESVMKQNMTLRSQPIALIYRFAKHSLSLTLSVSL